MTSAALSFRRLSVALLLVSSVLSACQSPRTPPPRVKAAPATARPVQPAPTPPPAPAAAAPAPQPTPAPPLPPLLIASAAEVQPCRLIARLGSLGPRMGESKEDSLKRTSAELMQKARELRATHLVWGDAQFPYAPASSIAQAYRCGR